MKYPTERPRRHLSSALPNRLFSWKGLTAITAIAALSLLASGCSSCGPPSYNTNTSHGDNANAVNSNTNSNASRASYNYNTSEADYQREKERYAREASEAGETIGSGIKDGWLWVKAKGALAATDDLDDSMIKVDVDNAKVTLRGYVENAGQRDKAVAAVKKIEGVRGVTVRLPILGEPMPTATATPSPTSSPGLDIDREVQNMKDGAAVTEVPTSMYEGETRAVVLILSPDAEKAQEVKKEVSAAISNRATQMPEKKIESKTKVEVEKAQYSRFMEAKLSGQGFEIKNVTPERQPVTNTQKTEWRWDVRATAPGVHNLHLTMNAIFEGDGSEKVRSVTTFTKFVEVETVRVPLRTQIGNFLSSYWQWLIGSIIIPLGGWLWAHTRKKKEG